MNNYITYCAQAKLLRLIESSGATSIKVKAHPRGGVDIETMFTSPSPCDIMIASVPKIYTDFFTLKQLTSSSVDFDYTTAEFVIKRARHVISTHAG